MKPGDRVTLIQQLSQELAARDYADLDLILRQFGLPWRQYWNGGRYEYALEMLEKGRDADLLALHEYLFGFSGEPDPLSGVEADCWAKGQFRLFLSHVSTDKILCSNLKIGLARFGISCFVAHEDIEPTREWVEEIERALASCDALVAILSQGFKESNWTDQEVGYCHARRVLIVSVRQGLDPYGFIQRYQAVNGNGKEPTVVARELYDILAKHERTSARMAEAIVGVFEESHSYANAKENVQLLLNVKAWTPELLRRVEAAVEANNQNRDAWGVASQVQALLRAHGIGSQPPSGSTGAAPPGALSDDDELPF